MFIKLIAINAHIEFALGDICLPQQYQTLVFQKTRELLGPRFPEVYSSREQQQFLALAATAREKELLTDIFLIEQSFVHLYTAMLKLKTELITTTFGETCFNLIEKALAELAILKESSIVEATAHSVTQLEVTMAHLLRSRGKYKNALDIRETQATLQRLNISDYTQLCSSAKTLILLRGFTLGIIFQTVNGLEGMQHENCIELANCPNSHYYSELLPAVLGSNILFHESLEKSLRTLMSWIEQDYLLG